MSKTYLYLYNCKLYIYIIIIRFSKSHERFRRTTFVKTFLLIVENVTQFSRSDVEDYSEVDTCVFGKISVDSYFSKVVCCASVVDSAVVLIPHKPD